jgi:hypothetical protein
MSDLGPIGFASGISIPELFFGIGFVPLLREMIMSGFLPSLNQPA